MTPPYCNSARVGALIVACAIFPATVAAQRATFASLNGKTGLSVQRFDVDWPHSAMEFAVRFMGLSTVRGSFADFGGTVMYDSSAITNSSVSIVIDTRSINTNVAFRDKDLKSPNFFDAEKYPIITFHSEKVEKVGDNKFIARGPLTMHGVTRPVAIEFEQIHPVSADAWGNRRVGFVGHTTLSRKEYGILGTRFWNSEYDPGKMSISDNVDVDLTLEAEVNQVERWTLPRGDSLLAKISAKGIRAALADFRAAAADTTAEPGKISDGILQSVTVKLMHRGQYADAIDAFKLATELHPDASWAYAGLGEAYLMTRKKPEAVEVLRKALVIDSTNTAAFEYLRYLR